MKKNKKTSKKKNSKKKNKKVEKKRGLQFGALTALSAAEAISILTPDKTLAAY